MTGNAPDRVTVTVEGERVGLDGTIGFDNAPGILDEVIDRLVAALGRI